MEMICGLSYEWGIILQISLIILFQISLKISSLCSILFFLSAPTSYQYCLNFILFTVPSIINYQLMQ